MDRPKIAQALDGYSEQGLVALMKQNMLTYSMFIGEIRRRIAVGDTVHQYHLACAKY